MVSPLRGETAFGRGRLLFVMLRRSHRTPAACAASSLLSVPVVDSPWRPSSRLVWIMGGVGALMGLVRGVWDFQRHGGFAEASQGDGFYVLGYLGGSAALLGLLGVAVGWGLQWGWRAFRSWEDDA
jgi:hypothetical protein